MVDDSNYALPTILEKTINIKDFFNSEWVDYAFAVELSLDLSYREKYAQQLKEVKQERKGGE